MPYAGGKQNLAHRIVALMPPHLHYVEPFAGALSVLLAKAPSHMETANDADREIMTFWRVLRDDPEGLERMCALTPHSRVEYMDSRRPGQGGTDLDVAWRVWVRLTQGRGGRSNGTSGWRAVHGGNSTSLAKYLEGYTSRIAPVADRLKNVSLECGDALQIIAHYDRPETLFYIDPPYLDSTRFAGMYAVEMGTMAQHSDLLNLLAGCRGKVILSGYRSQLYDKMLSGWTRIDMDAYCMTGEKRTESVWLNYTPPMVEEALL